MLLRLPSCYDGHHMVWHAQHGVVSEETVLRTAEAAHRRAMFLTSTEGDVSINALVRVHPRAVQPDGVPCLSGSFTFLEPVLCRVWWFHRTPTSFWAWPVWLPSRQTALGEEAIERSWRRTLRTQ